MEKSIIDILQQKSAIRHKVFDNTLSIFKTLKDVLQEMAKEYAMQMQGNKRLIVAYRDRGTFQCEIRIDSDILIFSLHTDIFEFDRGHSIWKNSYVQSNHEVSYCGIINIYNFLADSFKYERFEDLGYLIARIFVNKDFHYFVEGKRQFSFLYNNFGTSIIDKSGLKKIIESAMQYALEFDLLVPPYDAVKILSVAQIQEMQEKLNIKTGKRVGFQYNADDIQG